MLQRCHEDPCMTDHVLQTHASLEDWAEGHYKKTEFNADLYEDVYRGHEDVLTRIREKSPAAFHRLMADLYNSVA